MRTSASVAVLLLLFACSCKSQKADASKTQTSAAEATGKSTSPEAMPELRLGEKPSWPAPVLSEDFPAVTRVARVDGRDTIFVYGGKDAEGIGVRARWRDTSGMIIDSTTMTGGILSAGDSWWRYTTVKRSKDDKKPAAAAVEAQVTGLIYKDGKKWEPAERGSWRYPSTGKPTTTDGDIGFEPVAIERSLENDWGKEVVRGKIVVHVTNVGSTPKDRVDFQCELVDASGKAVVSDVGGAWVPLLGDHPHPKLLPRERAQVDAGKTLESAADKDLWAKKDLTARCALEKKK